MKIIEKINADFISAMKAKNEVELSTLRMLRSALKNKQIELLRELNEDEVLAVVKKQMKQLRDVLPSFETAGRTDLSDKAKSELIILEKYFPVENLEQKSV